MIDKTRMQAFNAWAKCLDSNSKIDSAINDLLERIAGKRYDIYYQDDDPIWTIIGSLTASERRIFIRGVDQIISKNI